jgi:aerobic-type carbon monoxide dehydrogenase small subunit (CoxS/CutS family)
MTAVTIYINGTPVTRDVPDDLALIDFLQEDLGLTGTKLWRGIGVCRACTVAVKRVESSVAVPVLACSTPAVLLDGEYVTTIEGVGSPSGLSKVQESFLHHFAFQCGYCAPGFVLATTMLLDRLRVAPIPEREIDAAIQDAVGAHICRCSGYARYHQAIRDLIHEQAGAVR